MDYHSKKTTGIKVVKSAAVADCEKFRIALDFDDGTNIYKDFKLPFGFNSSDLLAASVKKMQEMIADIAFERAV